MSKIQQQELTQEQIDAINNYSNEIVTLKDTVTAIRQVPGMYCGGKGNTGFISLIREIYQNGIDQIIDPTSPANLVTVYYNELTLEVEVTDNGKGFPFNDMIRMVTAQHTSKNYNKKKGEYSSGLHGSGLKVVNALSSKCIIKSFKYDGTAMELDLVEGYPIKDPYKIPNKENRQGSLVYFVPSLDVLGDINLEWTHVYALIKDILSLTPIGSEVIFTGIDRNNQKHVEHIKNTDGIITKLISTVKTPLIKPIIIGYDNGDFKIDVAFTYDLAEGNNDCYVTSFCNMCPTIDGQHIVGTLNGICNWFTKYMNNIYLANQKAKDKLKVIAADIKNGLNVMISGFCLEPLFVGQAKTQLEVPEMLKFASDTMMNGLDNWSKQSPQDLAKLSKFFKEIAELRMKQDKDKEKIVQKYASSSITGGLPSKYIRPLGNKDIELIIVEGDSALSNMATVRDRMKQGLLPLRGKIINAFAHSKTEFFNNAEVQAIQQIMYGHPYDKNQKIEDCKVNKVIFFADADIDESIVKKCFSKRPLGVISM